MWTTVEFGKFRGKGLSFPQIAFKDPDWLLYNYYESRFQGGLAIEAERIVALMRSIKINRPDPTKWEVEYTIFRGKFEHTQIVLAEKPTHLGSSSTIRLPHLDMNIPRDQRGYDKLGYRNMIHNFKEIWLGGSGARITKAKAEAFFETKSNFI